MREEDAWQKHLRLSCKFRSVFMADDASIPFAGMRLLVGLDAGRGETGRRAWSNPTPSPSSHLC